VPTVLDGIRESHDGPEPRVKTADVKAILQAFIGRGSDPGKSVALIAERSDVSTRTVYRVIQADKETLSLRLADQLVTLGAGSHLALCTLVWPDGRETPYVSL
jgi:DNA invertase Pin-like site-specific DNA recombinase